MKFWIICVVVSAIIIVPAFAQSGDEKAFLDDLKKTRDLIDNGRWDRASKLLTKLLEDHANQDYVLAKQLEIEDCVETCAFWEDYEQPQYKDLLSGQLLSYKESSGAIKIRYTPDTMEDFAKAKDKDNAYTRTSAFVHPALFDGPYTIEVKGSRHPSIDSPLVPFFIACLDADGYFRIVTGKKGEGSGRTTTWLPPKASFVTKEKTENLEEKACSPATPNKPFVLKLKVTATKVAAYFENKEIISVKKPKDLYGRAGFMGMPFDEVIISGIVQPAWLQGLRDADMQTARLKFEERYNPKHYLPEWLHRENDPVAEASSQFIRIPGAVVDKQEAHVKKAESLYNAKKYDEGMEYITKVADNEISKGSRTFIMALFLKAQEQYESALAQCEKACESDPESYTAKVFRVSLEIDLGRTLQAEKGLRSLIEAYPDEPAAYSMLSRRLLLNGKLSDAEGMLEQARSKQLSSNDLDEISRILFKVKSGPTWQKVHEHESKHY
ncbi:MAG: tetratricopeptide repeat protein, partial [Planctomycetota bacterium]